MQFFKSMQTQYAETFFAEGKLRIGSLYDFRRVEDYGNETGDSGEGTKELYTDQRHISERTIPEFLQHKIRVGPGSRLDIVVDGDNPVSAQFQDPDLYKKGPVKLSLYRPYMLIRRPCERRRR